MYDNSDFLSDFFGGGSLALYLGIHRIYCGPALCQSFQVNWTSLGSLSGADIKGLETRLLSGDS